MGLAACDSDDDDDDDDDFTGTSIRYINAIAESETIEFTLDEDVFSLDVNYGFSSEKIDYDPATIEITAAVVDADGEKTDLDVEETIQLEAGDELIFILYGTLDSPQSLVVKSDYFAEDDDDDEQDISRVGVIGLSERQTNLDVYLTEGDDGLFPNDPVMNAQYGAFDGMYDIEPGTYSLRFTLEGEKEAVYDAGEVNLIDDRNIIYAVIDYREFAGDTIVAIEMSGSGISDQLISEDIPVNIRFLNAIPDYPSVDIYLGDTADEPEYSNITFGEITEFLELEADSYSLNITPHGVKDTFFFERDLDTVAGERSTLVFAGLATDDDIGVKGNLISENRETLASEAWISFVHAAPSLEGLDLYILSPGQPVSDAVPRVDNIDYLLSSSSKVDAKSYDIVLTQADNDVVVLGPVRVTLDVDDELNLYLVDSEGGGTPPEILQVMN